MNIIINIKLMNNNENNNINIQKVMIINVMYK